MLMKSRFSTIAMVLLVVGEEKTEISVHENVLFAASPVFKTAFTSEYKEASARSMYLPDDDADLMDALIQDLYAPQSALREIGSTMEFLRLYVLADKYDIVRVKNRICDLLVSSSRGLLPSTSEIEYAYENATSERPIRRVLVDLFIWRTNESWFNREENRRWLTSVPEFAVDLCAGLATFGLGSKNYAWGRNTSFYWERDPQDPDATESEH